MWRNCCDQNVGAALHATVKFWQQQQYMRTYLLLKEFFMVGYISRIWKVRRGVAEGREDGCCDLHKQACMSEMGEDWRATLASAPWGCSSGAAWWHRSIHWESLSDSQQRDAPSIRALASLIASPQCVASKESPPSPTAAQEAPRKTHVLTWEKAQSTSTMQTQPSEGIGVSLVNWGCIARGGGKKTMRQDRRFGEAMLRVVNDAGCVSEGFLCCNLLRQSVQTSLVEYFEATLGVLMQDSEC